MRPVSPLSGPPPRGWKAITIAEDQPEYIPLPALVGETFDRPTVSRWRLTFLERLQIAVFGDIWLTLLTFGDPLQPIKMHAIRPYYTLGLPKASASN